LTAFKLISFNLVLCFVALDKNGGTMYFLTRR